MSNLTVQTDEPHVSSSLRDKIYWRKQLGQQAESVRIPYEFHNTSHSDDVRHVVSRPLQETQCAQLLNLARDADRSLHLILLATWQLLVSKYAATEDIVVATPGYTQGGGKNLQLLILRYNLSEAASVKDLLVQTKNRFFEAQANQNLEAAGLAELLKETLNLERDDVALSRFCDTQLLLTNVQAREAIRLQDTALCLEATRTNRRILISLHYDPLKYSQEYVLRVLDHYIVLLAQFAGHPLQTIRDISLCTAEEHERILKQFNRAPVAFADDVGAHELVIRAAETDPSRIALRYENGHISYGELVREAKQIASYLSCHCVLGPEERVGILMDRSVSCYTAMLGVLMAGGAYVPLNVELSNERLSRIVADAGIRIICSQSKYIKKLNELQWSCDSLTRYVCLDTENVAAVSEAEHSELMSQQLWHFIGEQATDDITGGGWFSSYTGDPISREEMDEYQQNVIRKLSPFLSKTARVLEIGCASGITMFGLAEKVGFYLGTDLSEVIIEKNKRRVASENIDNVHLRTLPAHEIDQLTESGFDVVIINSVIQDFQGHNYLKQVIAKVIEKMSDKGVLFIGDVMDRDEKQSLIDDLRAYKRQHSDRNIRTKLDWHAELFVSRHFFEDLQADFNNVTDVNCSGKIYTIPNELTLYRFDAMIHIDKSITTVNKRYQRHKYQDDLSTVSAYSFDDFASPEQALAAGNNLAYVIFTSGSTGVPKGAMIEHRGLINHAQAKINDLGITSQSVVAQNASLHFDISVWQYFSPLSVGASVCIYPDELILQPDQFISRLIEDRVTVLEVVPSYLSVLLETIKNKNYCFPDLKNLVVTGETVKPELVNEWLSLFPDIAVVNAYGPTEASDDITHHIMTEAVANARVPIGKPIQNMTVTIRDPNMNLCPVGVKGEICVSGVGVGRGYISDPAKTEAVFLDACEKHPRLYKTGDIGVWLADGTVDFFGRRDYQVKIRGFRVELGDIETTIRQHSAVKDVKVVLKESPTLQKLVAFFVPEETHIQDAKGAALADDLKRIVHRELPDYMVPGRFVEVPVLPLTANGKTDTKALEALAEEQGKENLVKPVSEIEIQISQIWAAVLDLDVSTISVTDDFFDLGGNSIAVLKVATAITRKLGIEVPMGTLFLNKTIRELCLVLEQESVLDTTRCVVKLTNQERPEKAFFVHTADGTVFSYRGLAKLLADTHQVYGIQARGLVDQWALPTSYQELIGEYLHEILKVQPQGPYVVGGHCMGAFISYELVRLLEGLGHEVKSLVIMDVPVTLPNYYINYLRVKKRITQLLSGLVKRDESVGSYYYYAKAENINGERRGGDEVLEFGSWKKQIDDNINTLINYKYRPRQLISSPITVVSSKESFYKRLTHEEWQKMTTGPVWFSEMPGDHDSMFYPPNVSVLHNTIVAGLSDLDTREGGA